jgi:hypothetical protein
MARLGGDGEILTQATWQAFHCFLQCRSTVLERQDGTHSSGPSYADGNVIVVLPSKLKQQILLTEHQHNGTGARFAPKKALAFSVKKQMNINRGFVPGVDRYIMEGPVRWQKNILRLVK